VVNLSCHGCTPGDQYGLILNQNVAEDLTVPRVAVKNRFYLDGSYPQKTGNEFRESKCRYSIGDTVLKFLLCECYSERVTPGKKWPEVNP
jgi:hypothetical protein